MKFNSLVYLLFLTVTLLVYFGARRSQRLFILIAASLVFYGFWSVPLIGLIVISGLVDFSAGLFIQRSERQSARLAWLVSSLGINLGILCYVKYANFFLESVRAVVGTDSLGRVVEIALPPGISFYTFQSMSYTIDVYRGQIAATRSFSRFFLYVMFFPQLVAGPIERAGHLLTQFDYVIGQRFSAVNLAVGSRMIIWGLFKKVMIADYCADVVEQVYASPGSHSGWSALVGTYAFTLQIYCDFSAYSEIAMGSARMFGVELMKNFDQPYLAGTVADFWRRWHISLSTWFRDYLYIPLGGSQKGKVRTLANLVITMFLSGLWHGAAWTFVLWGLLHGFFLLLHALISPSRWFRALAASCGACWGFLAWFVTFHCAVAGWILFRGGTLENSGAIFRGILQIPFHAGLPTAFEAAFLVIMALFLFGSYLRRRLHLFDVIHADTGLSVLFYSAIIVIMCLWGKVDGPSFIYFQF